MAGGFNAGSVFVKLGFDVDDSGADRYDRRVADVKRRADRPIKQEAKLDVDERGFERFGRGVDKADRDAGRLRLGMGRLGGASAGIATGIGGVGIAAIGASAGVASLIGAYQESYKIGKQTEAVLKSTGGAANVSAKQVGDLATALSKKTGIDDEAVQSGENLLLTFTKIRNESGKGNDVFDQATATALDLSKALGTDVSSASMQLGKALNDPIKGVAALGRAGVQFTAQQKDQIKTLVESGKTLDAQKMILREVDKQVGGSAEAQATNTDRLKVSMGNLAENIGGKLAPLAEKASGVISRFVDDLNDGDTSAGKFGKGVQAAGGFVSRAARVIGGAISDIVGWFKRIYRDNADTIGSIGKSFSSLANTGKRAFKGIKEALSSAFGGSSGTGRDIRKIAGFLLDFADVAMKVYSAVVKRALPGIITAFKGLATVVRGVIRVITGILSGDFGKAWDGVRDIFNGGIRFIGGVLRAATAPFRAAASAIAKGVSGPLSSLWGSIKSAWGSGLDFILGGVSTAQGAIAKLLDAAGHLPLVGGKFKGLADKVREGQKAIDEYRESLRKTDKQHAQTQNIKNLQTEVGGLRSKLRTLKKGSDDYRDTAEKLRSKQRALNTVMADAQGAGKKGAKGAKAIGDAGSNAATAAYEAALSISNNLQNLSKGLGLKAPSFNIKVPRGQGVSGGGTSSADDAAFVKGHAVGGIPNPGSGGRDDHLLLDASGRPVAMMSGTEGILNTPQMQIVDQALQVARAVGMTPYGGLNDLWSSGMRHYAGGGILQRANQLDRMQLPYKWGGHHGDSGPIRDPRPGLDCSSAVSYVLGIPPRVSGALETIGKPGPGPVTIFANADHTFMSIAGRGFGTSAENPGGGPGWLSYSSRPGFVVRHVDAGVGDAGPGGEVSAPRIVGPAGALRSVVQGSAGSMAKSANAWLSKQMASMDFAGGQPLSEGLTGGTSGENQAIGRKMLASSAQWPALKELWTRESGWSVSADNPTSDAYGIPQALPGSRMASAGPDWKTNPATQIKWGLGYIRERYGTPSAALAFHNRNNWYSGGGLLPAFAGGGKLDKGKKKPSFKEAALDDAGLGASAFRFLRGKQSDRVGAFDAVQVALDTDGKRYSLQERRNDLTDETFVDEETGQVRLGDVKRRAEELRALASIKQRMRDRLAKGKQIAHRVQQTYSTILARLKKALKAASGTKGKGAKARKKAAESYRAQIRDYTSRKKEWAGKEQDIGFDLEDASIDLRALQGERSEVLGTKTVLPEPDAPAEGDVPDLPDVPDVDGGSADPGTADTPDPTTAAETAAPSAEDIARGVAQQFASFQAGRADLFGSFGGNFVRSTIPVGLGGDMQNAAGTRFFGGGEGGTDGGVLAGGGGQGGPQVVQNITFTGPAPADPHVMTQTSLHEMQAALS
jgi:hypothetical protein